MDRHQIIYCFTFGLNKVPLGCSDLQGPRQIILTPRNDLLCPVPFSSVEIMQPSAWFISYFRLTASNLSIGINIGLYPPSSISRFIGHIFIPDWRTRDGLILPSRVCAGSVTLENHHASCCGCPQNSKHPVKIVALLQYTWRKIFKVVGRSAITARAFAKMEGSVIFNNHRKITFPG